MPASAAVVGAFGSFRFMTFLLLVCSPSPFFLNFLVLFLTLAMLRTFQEESQAQRHYVFRGSWLCTKSGCTLAALALLTERMFESRQALRRMGPSLEPECFTAMMSHHPTRMFLGQQPVLTFVWRQLTSGTIVPVPATRLYTTNQLRHFGRGWSCYKGETPGLIT